MSYAYDYPIAERAPADERAAFIRRTYGHLAGAILAFVAVETLLVQAMNTVPAVQNAVAGLFAFRFGWLILMLGFVGVSWLANSWALSGASPGLQYLGLSLYVVAEAVIFMPLLWIATQVYPDAIPVAGILTLTIFGGLTAAVLMTRRDFSYLGPILSIAGFLAIGLIVVSILFGFQLGTLFCFAMVALACGYILYDTSNVLHRYRTDQHVAAALALFASVALLFWYILRILLASQSRR
jgi:FtsH-binding integral membrane protein